VIAALYIDPRGPYPALLGRELCWDESRDAKSYDGPGPIVAHPPCGPWGRSRHLYTGNEHDCAPRAVEQVRRVGGVLEHPAQSRLWREGPRCSVASGQHCHHFSEDGGPCCACAFESLPYPEHAEDSFGGFTVQVDQVEWGHCARKRTWLYVVGVSRETVDAMIAARPFPGRQPTHWVSGRRGMALASRNVPPGIKVCGAEQRRKTPPHFADFLIGIAMKVKAQ
jgi:hypothetical protein